MNLIEFIGDFGYCVAYYFVLPFYFLIGLIGNILLLAAFLKHSKSEKAYAYQIFFTVCKAIEILCSSTFWWCYKLLAGVEWPGHPWYMNNYPLMFYAAHIGCPLSNGFLVTALLLSVAMAADRVFALTHPLLYNIIHHRRHQAIALLACLFVGLSTSAFEVKRWRLVHVGNMTNGSVLYKVEYDQEYLGMAAVMAMGHARSILRLLALLLLFILSIVLLVALHKRLKKVDRMSIHDDKKERERRATERTLMLLTVYQSVLMTISQLPHSGYLIAAFMSPWFNQCYGAIVSSYTDMCIELADIIDIFIIIALNRRTRRSVINVLPKWVIRLWKRWARIDEEPRQQRQHIGLRRCWTVFSRAQQTALHL